MPILRRSEAAPLKGIGRRAVRMPVRANADAVRQSSSAADGQFDQTEKVLLAPDLFGLIRGDGVTVFVS
jgi:hypothetical protein